MSPLRTRAADLRRMAQELLALADELEGASNRPAAARKAELHGEGAQSLRAVAQEAYRARRERERFFPDDLFFEPAWDMLLDLFVAACDDKLTPTKSLSIASGVAGSTALRHIDVLVGAGLARRREDREDARRTFVVLTDEGRQAMADYLRHIRGARLHPAPELTVVTGRLDEAANAD